MYKNSCLFYSQLKCQRNNLCNEAGRCLEDRDQTDGFKCECVDNYYGKYCQFEKYCKDHKHFDINRGIRAFAAFRQHTLKDNGICFIIRGCLHESRLSYSPNRVNSVSVETIRN